MIVEVAEQEIAGSSEVRNRAFCLTRFLPLFYFMPQVRYYKKPLLNAFPRRVDRYLVPVEGYSLPAKEGDEQAVSALRNARVPSRATNEFPLFLLRLAAIAASRELSASFRGL